MCVCMCMRNRNRNVCVSKVEIQCVCSEIKVSEFLQKNDRRDGKEERQLDATITVY